MQFNCVVKIPKGNQSDKSFSAVLACVVVMSFPCGRHEARKVGIPNITWHAAERNVLGTNSYTGSSAKVAQ